MELVARTDTLHLDTYLMSAGKVLWNFTGGGEKGGDPPRSAGIALTVHPSKIRKKEARKVAFAESYSACAGPYGIHTYGKHHLPSFLDVRTYVRTLPTYAATRR